MVYACKAMRHNIVRDRDHNHEEAEFQAPGN